MDIKIIYEDDSLLVVDKPAGVVVFPEGEFLKREVVLKREVGTPSTLIPSTLIDALIEDRPKLKDVGEAPRFGMVHRLDKDTSGVLLVAKTNESLEFLQKQFQESNVKKIYLALVVGCPKNEKGRIETLLGRAPSDRRKQKVYLPFSPDAVGKRNAITNYKVVEKFSKYALIEIELETGRKHQIRAHLSYLGNPIAGDNLYGFKGQLCPKELARQFLHSNKLEITLPSGGRKEFVSELPDELKNILDNLKQNDN